MRLKSALERLDDDEWGWCVQCGGKIAGGRLRNDPSVALCVGCAAK
ncbi:TraR/DksA C4-type zinc finger protein [Aurantiacibacter odishensis]|nr:TraR/DksA C4-type zinc finger protein [Aurantiacibacter odishensis]